MFSIVRTGTTITLGIPPGSYTITTLITALNLIWNPLRIDFQYDPATLKVSIIELDGTPFKINKEAATLRTALGFTEGYDY